MYFNQSSKVLDRLNKRVGLDVLLISFQNGLDILNLKILHYYLLQAQYDSSILCLPYFDSNDARIIGDIKGFISLQRPNLIGMTVMSDDYANASSLTSFFKTSFPSIPIIWGGIHPTTAPDMCLDYADYVCIGEGEKTLVDLCGAIANGKSTKDVPNLCYKDNGEIIKNPLNPLIKNLDEIPNFEHIPARSYVAYHGKVIPLTQKAFFKIDRFSGKFYQTITSRDCLFSCTYCCNNILNRLYNKKGIRRRSVSNIIAELKKAITDHPRIETINFHDDCFISAKIDYLLEFCSQYRKEIGRGFNINAIPMFVTREKLKMLKDAGLSWVCLGLQSGSDRVCSEIYNRKSSKKHFIRAAEIIHDLKLAAQYDIIFDNPFETEEDRFETIDTLMKTPKPYYTQFFSLTFYLGSELYNRVKLEKSVEIKDPLKKDYMKVRKDLLNEITKLTTIWNSYYIDKLTNLYKKNPRSILLQILLSFMKLWTIFILEPYTYIRLIKLSQNGSYLKTLKVTPVYFHEGIKKYIKRWL